ncbi:MAG: hypothetical protein HND52_01800 [Ignavibacteriae bacterium]|jgi:hypothetical protein|nr:hypothetical protein [Ignavibacteriota bacterium]NOG96684.1 hypothetical protein [Ignavibacteriota bacterium]
MKNLIFTICLLGIFSSCSLLDNPPNESEQSIFFELEHVNYAWGYQHAGFYVNRKGEVFTYQYESNSAPWQPNENNYYTEA